MGSVQRGLITRDDVAHWDGVTRTSSRVDATGGTQTGLNFGDSVDILQVFGSGTSRSVATINTAIARLGGANATFLFSTGTWIIDADLTIPANVTIYVPFATTISIDSGKTLTINGHVEAGQYQIFSGSGTAAGFGNNSSITPIWWQENTTPGTTDMTTAVAATASVLVAAGGGVVFFPKGTYAIDEFLIAGTSGTHLANVVLIGEGAKIFANVYTKAGGIIRASYVDGLEIYGFEVDGNYDNQTDIAGNHNHAFHTTVCTEVNIHNNYVHHLGYGSGVDKQGDGLYVDGACADIKFMDNTVRAWGRWVVAVTDTCAGLTISRNTCLQYAADTVEGLGFSDLEPNASDLPITQVKISDNTCYWRCSNSISNTGAATLVHKDIIYSNNIFLGHYTDDDTTFAGDAYNYGIIIAMCQHVIITGNYIRLGNDSSNCIQTSDSGALTPSDITVSNNRLYHSAGNGINFQNADDSIAIDNYIELTGGAGLAIDVNTGCQRCSLIGNTVVYAGSSNNPVVFSTTGVSVCANNNITGGQRISSLANDDNYFYGNSGTPIEYGNVAGATSVHIQSGYAAAHTNLVTAPVEGQKAVLPYFVKQILQHTAAPTTGAWAVGDMVFNTAPTAGGTIGWVCTTAGSPGTWKTFGVIAA